MPTFADVYGEKYLLLTTFTKDGRPKPTTVWGVPEGDKLLISTDDGSWKTKRINNTPRVTIQKCSALGKPKGEPVEAVARNLPKSETRRVFDNGDQALLVARVVVGAAGASARWHRQGARRDRGRGSAPRNPRGPRRAFTEHGDAAVLGLRARRAGGDGGAGVDDRFRLDRVAVARHVRARSRAGRFAGQAPDSAGCSPG